MLKLLQDLKSAEVISELNYQFARFIERKQQRYQYSQIEQNLALFLSALLSYSVMQGHTALRLDQALIENPFNLKEYRGERDFKSELLQKIEGMLPLEWQNVLQHHVAFSHEVEKVAPMLFQNGLVYFYRYWQAEHCIANYLLQAVKKSKDFADSALDKAVLSQLFPHEESTKINWQKVAVATALRQHFCLISGGPGTGKTYTVSAVLLALQLKQIKQNKPLLNIALAAPTGKAAARMIESIKVNLAHFDAPQTLKESLPSNAQTIHRLIGIRPLQDKPFYHNQNPLHLDVLVIDEASMIDVSLMEKLINALKPTTRLIMLGDKDQLASVEAGAVMGDLRQFILDEYRPEQTNYLQEVTGYLLPQSMELPEICNALCYLKESRRFNEDSGIGKLAGAINIQNAFASWQIFSEEKLRDLSLKSYPLIKDFKEKHLWQQACAKEVALQAVEQYRSYLTLVQQKLADPQAVKIQDIFTHFESVRFLTALRVSELGSEQLNQRIAETLRQAKLVEFHHDREQYAGKPILITENDPANNIFSGDIGIILPDDNGVLKAFFATSNEEIRAISLNRLPHTEPAYAMTVHKSQGSEFAHTFFIMPTHFSPVLSKELLYTAVTRAKTKLTVFSDQRTWQQAVQTKVERQSGLKEQIMSLFS